jgi:hypothetical protein
MRCCLGSSYFEATLMGSSSAIFSRCKKYRYRLDRIWDDSLPPVSFGMLNPSTADHEYNDPTIERCERRAKSLGFGSLIVWNLFAFRATNPKRLKDETDPVGPENDGFISEALHETKSRGGKVVVGWGMHGQYLDRDAIVSDAARAVSVSLYCLGTTHSGQPKHPLYIPYERELAYWS